MADDTKDTKESTEDDKAKTRAEKRANSMSDLPGFDKELERLKEERIKFQKKNKTEEIKRSFGPIISMPIAGVIIYFIITSQQFISFLELDPEMVRNIGTIVMVVFIMAELQAIFRFIKNLFINPGVITEETLSFLTLTAKEHILDPKGSVIREKYGTAKWSSVTQT